MSSDPADSPSKFRRGDSTEVRVLVPSKVCADFIDRFS